MPRYCYYSVILQGKQDAVRDHWFKKKIDHNKATQESETQFWNALRMTGFESWLQTSSNLMIHCLEGESWEQIFKGLREQIRAGNSVASKLHAFYKEVLGKDYSLQETEPKIEKLFDIELAPFVPGNIKKGFVYPLLPDKEQEHRKFRSESMGLKRSRHEASMRAFGVSRLSTWLQSTPEGKYIVVYSERQANCPKTPEERLARGNESQEWQEIAVELMDHTGLSYQDLSPDVVWLTQKT